MVGNSLVYLELLVPNHFLQLFRAKGKYYDIPQLFYSSSIHSAYYKKYKLYIITKKLFLKIMVCSSAGQSNTIKALNH